MSLMQDELEKLETLCATLETRLESQYRDLSSVFPATYLLESESYGFDTQLLDAERRLARLISARDMNDRAREVDGTALSVHAALLLKRARRLQELVERNAAEFRQLQDAVRKALRELHVGGQFLGSMRNCGHRSPKYVDALQ